jgi:pyruvate/2-oxoglutarate dehydrogenase complex dihydrolipoamide acyltransferase (E2) component
MDIVDVLLPQYGMGMQDGEVAVWHKKVGDTVASGELLAEVEAAKTTCELFSPCDGELIEIVVAPGKSTAVRAVVARVRRHV